MFTVVLPVYNHSKYVSEAILTAYADALVTEILVVDDGSKDDSAQVVEKLGAMLADKLRIIPNPSNENHGAHRRLNQLISEARNEWVAVLNSDDFFYPNRFAAIKSYVFYNEVDVVIGSIIIVDSDSKVTGVKLIHQHFEYDPPERIVRDRLRLEGELFDLLCNQNIAATTSNFVLRKSTWESVGGFADYRYAHDWEYLLKVSLVGRVGFCPTALTAYRLHGSNTISEGRALIVAEQRKLIENFITACPDPELAFHKFADNRYLQVDSVEFAEGHIYYYRYGDISSPLPVEIYKAKFFGAFREPTINEKNNVALLLMLYDVDGVVFRRGVDATINNAASGLPFILTRVIDFPMPDDRPLTYRSITLLSEVQEEKYDLQKNALIDNVSELNREGSVSRRRTYGYARRGFTRGGSAKPVIFVLPGFIAVGGVERVLEHVVEELAEYFTFVIINTEKLPAGLGTFSPEIAAYAECIYEMPSYVDERDFVDALAILRDEYRPTGVWICNGAMWHIKNMGALRKIFKNSLIFDQQCYDHRFGWIQNYNNPNLHFSDYYIGCNKKITEALEKDFGIPSEKAVTIYPMFDSEKFVGKLYLRESEFSDEVRRKLNIPLDAVLLGTAARVSSQKRPWSYVDLAVDLADRGISCHILYIGDGPLLEETMAYAKECQASNITFYGHSDDPSEVMAALDAMVILSEYEGLPVAMLEALSLGVPVVSTDVGEIRRVLEPLGAGMILSSHDRLGIINGVSEFLEKIEDFKNSARTARDGISRRFSKETIANEYRELFMKGSRP